MEKRVYICPQTETMQIEMTGKIMDSSITTTPVQPAPKFIGSPIE